MVSRRLGQLILVGTVIWLLIACGSDEGGGETAITVVASEFAFNPSSVNVAAAQDVTVTLENSGVEEHEWVILGAGTNISIESEFEESQVAFRLPVGAGESASDIINLPQGSYQIVCTILGHFTEGMEGTLTVGSG